MAIVNNKFRIKKDTGKDLIEMFGTLFEYVSKWKSPVRDLEWEAKVAEEYNNYQEEKRVDIVPKIKRGYFPLTGAYLMYFLDKIGVGIPGESIVVDLGARDWNPTSNIRYLCFKRKFYFS